MGTLYFVRHGQASFGADNYDQLSDLGFQQAERLGGYFAAHGVRFDAVLLGSLTRHRQTLEGMDRGYSATLTGADGKGLINDAEVWPGLNEYDSEAVIKAVHPGPLGKADTPEQYRAHFQWLRRGLTAWAQGLAQPQGMPSYLDFKAGVQQALQHVQNHYEGSVLVVSSGGPISLAVADLMGASPEAGIELNFRMRNSAVSELVFNKKRHTVVSFNTLPHLASPELASWVTFT